MRCQGALEKLWLSPGASWGQGCAKYHFIIRVLNGPPILKTSPGAYCTKRIGKIHAISKVSFRVPLSLNDARLRLHVLHAACVGQHGHAFKSPNSSKLLELELEAVCCGARFAAEPPKFSFPCTNAFVERHPHPNKKYDYT